MSIIFILCLYPHFACSGRAAQPCLCSRSPLTKATPAVVASAGLGPSGTLQWAHLGWGGGSPSPPTLLWGLRRGRRGLFCATDAVGAALLPSSGLPAGCGPPGTGGGGGSPWSERVLGPPLFPLPKVMPRGASAAEQPYDPHFKLLQHLCEVTPGGDAELARPRRLCPPAP